MSLTQTTPLARTTEARPMPDRLSRRTSLLVIAGISVLLWAGIAWATGLLQG